MGAMWWLVMCSAVAGCGDDDPALPPPPAEAVTNCVTTIDSATGNATATLWFNDRHQVIRADGVFAYADHVAPAAYYMAYDEQGRLVEERTPIEAVQIAYSAQGIVVGEDVLRRWPRSRSNDVRPALHL